LTTIHLREWLSLAARQRRVFAIVNVSEAV